MAIGFALSSEEHPPRTLVELARRAEEAGFDFCTISDHYHPWVNAQGHSPFVWAALGAIAQVTKRLKLSTHVTCPILRIHPAIVAQAAATVGCLLPGRFVLGVGSGENLNEHILGDAWPVTAIRHDMLEEAVDVIRTLWKGGQQSYYGNHFVVENARVYDLPDPLPPIFLAAAGPKAAKLAGSIGDGLVTTSPNQEVVQVFQDSGGQGKPTLAEATTCWRPDREEAIRMAHERWPNSGLPGELSQELPTPKHFEQAAQLVRPEAIAESIVCGSDPEEHVQRIRQYLDAGIENVTIHNVGADQDGYFEWAARELLPRLEEARGGFMSSL